MDIPKSVSSVYPGNKGGKDMEYSITICKRKEDIVRTSIILKYAIYVWIKHLKRH